jgi:hypothetical protein
MRGCKVTGIVAAEGCVGGITIYSDFSRGKTFL